jgi:hypothetical protein
MKNNLSDIQKMLIVFSCAAIFYAALLWLLIQASQR